jgi:hypothetical protein
MFYVDLEPNTNNKTIYNLKSLLHMRITVEAPKYNASGVRNLDTLTLTVHYRLCASDVVRIMTTEIVISRRTPNLHAPTAQATTQLATMAAQNTKNE